MKRTVTILLLFALSLISGGRAGSSWAARKVHPKDGAPNRSPRPERWKIGMLCAKTDSCQMVKDPIGAVEKAVREHPDLAMLVGPDFLLVSKETFHNPAEYRRVLKKLQAVSKGNEMLIAPGTLLRKRGKSFQNTHVTVSNGQVLKEYAKQRNGGESVIARWSGLKWKPGQRDGLFEWQRKGQTYRVGAEICIDHGCKLLSDETLAKGQPIDVHIVQACGYDRIDPNLAIGPGGLFVFNDGVRGRAPRKQDVRRFQKEKKVKGSFAGVDRYWGWKPEQISWKPGKAGEPIKLADDVELLIFSVQGPRPGK